MSKILCYILVLLFSTAQAQRIGEGFQKFRAEVYHCINKQNDLTCLSSYLGESITGNSEQRQKEILIATLTKDARLFNQFSACFNPQAIVEAGLSNHVVFRGDRYACTAERKEGTWQLIQFYDYFSD